MRLIKKVSGTMLRFLPSYHEQLRGRIFRVNPLRKGDLGPKTTSLWHDARIFAQSLKFQAGKSDAITAKDGGLPELVPGRSPRTQVVESCQDPRYACGPL